MPQPVPLATVLCSLYHAVRAEGQLGLGRSRNNGKSRRLQEEVITELGPGAIPAFIRQMWGGTTKEHLEGRSGDVSRKQDWDHVACP